MKIWRFVTVVLTMSALAACGGGGSGPSVPGTSLTPSSTAAGSGTSQNNPMLVPLGAPNVMAGVVGTGYYKFTTGAAATYDVSLTNASADFSWTVSTDPYSFDWVTDCDGYQSTNLDRICATSNLNASTTYYLRVHNWSGNSPANYAITINKGIGEGSVKDPVPLVIGATHSGGIKTNGYSYYTFTTAVDGSYTVALSDTAATVLWDLYNVSTFSSPMTGYSCNSNYTSGPVTCAASNIPAGTYYLRLFGPGQGSTYSISVNSQGGGSYVNAPMQLSPDAIQHANIDPNGYGYFYFVPPQGGTFKINIANSTVNTWWALYPDSSYTTPTMTCNNNPIPGGESCMTGSLDKTPAAYFIKVFTDSTVSGAYDISVTGDGCSEGSIKNPIELFPGTTHSSKVAYDTYGKPYPSYYKLTTGAAATPYMVTLANVASGADLYWNAYTNAGFTALAGGCNFNDQAYNGDKLCSSTDYNGPVTLAANSTYYFTIGNSGQVPSAFSMTPIPFGVSLGCSSGGSCYDFEGATMPADFTLTGQAWAPDSTQVGSGTKSIKSGAPKGASHISCFQFSATDAKWIAFSAYLPTADFFDKILVYDGATNIMSLIGNTQWQRVYFTPTSGGAHTYKWCYDAGAAGYAWIDDIEIVK
ncbi:MAG: hypothetical protein WCD00_11420 [Desulfuromonadaceae bacterium]